MDVVKVGVSESTAFFMADCMDGSIESYTAFMFFMIWSDIRFTCTVKSNATFGLTFGYNTISQSNVSNGSIGIVSDNNVYTAPPLHVNRSVVNCGIPALLIERAVSSYNA